MWTSCGTCSNFVCMEKWLRTSLVRTLNCNRYTSSYCRKRLNIVQTSSCLISYVLQKNFSVGHSNRLKICLENPLIRRSFGGRSSINTTVGSLITKSAAAAPISWCTVLANDAVLVEQRSTVWTLRVGRPFQNMYQIHALS